MRRQGEEAGRGCYGPRGWEAACTHVPLPHCVVVAAAEQQRGVVRPGESRDGVAVLLRVVAHHGSKGVDGGPLVRMSGTVAVSTQSYPRSGGESVQK